MSNEVVTAKGKKDEVEHTISVDFDFGDDLEMAVDLFGGELVFAKFKASAKIDAQAKIRRDVAAGKDEAAIKESFKSWKPGMPTERKAKDPVDQIVSKWKDMSESQRAEMLKRLKAAE